MAVSTTTASGSNYSSPAGSDDAFNSAAWKALSPDYQALLEEWAVNLMSNSGYTFDVTHADLLKIAQATHFTSEQGFAQWTYQNLFNDDQRAATPWVAYATDYSSYQGALNSYQEVWQKLTGGSNYQDVGFQSFMKSAMTQRLGAGAFEQSLMLEPGMQNVYGWLKYGMTYERFKEYKNSQRTAYGNDLTDQQALTAYANNQAAQGRGFEVSQQAQGSQQQAPRGGTTLTTVR